MNRYGSDQEHRKVLKIIKTVNLPVLTMCMAIPQSFQIGQ